MTTNRPWVKLYDGYPEDMDIPDATMYEMFARSVAARPDQVGLLYMGRHFTFFELLTQVDACAAAFTAYGIQPHDAVVLSLPNVPNAVIAFYALNKIGAQAVMTHPLSSPSELKHYIQVTGAQWVVTMDMFYSVFRDLSRQTTLDRLVIARLPDYLGPVMKIGFKLTKGRQIEAVPGDDPLVLDWRDFLSTGAGLIQQEAAGGEPTPYTRPVEPSDTAVILFSGGTTNLPKGIELTSYNFNALAVAIEAISGITPGDSVLAILPVFHGFGLGLCIHSALVSGAYPILVPEFSAGNYINNLVKYKPAYIAGVPTLFQAMMGNPKFKKVRFDKLKGAYSGGDLLSADLKRRFDEAIKSQGATVELMEGYGLTECVTACALSPRNLYRENSMGIPMPGMLVKVADSATGEELPYGTVGELCVSGPTLMKGYVNDPDATQEALREHADGRIWLHTGDIGTMDSDGYLYFMGRMKRMVKVSGVSVYPLQVEQVLEDHPLVSRACVIGVPDDYQVTSLKAFVVLVEGTEPSDETRDALIAHCKEQLIKWSVPRQFEFRTALPMTRVGKIAYTELEKEELAKLQS